jgi:hypothetical protein
LTHYPLNPAPLTLNDYAAGRDALLARIVAHLLVDRRMVAAWLEGSFGRNEADRVSDLDLHLAVADPSSQSLCLHPQPRNAGGAAAPERLALISAFGRPAVIHENHHNAPAGGSFSFVLYSTSAVMVDWVLTPLSMAARLPESLLLFEKAAVPVLADELPLAEELPPTDVSERIAFFWMMAAVACKYIIRRENETVAWFIQVLQETLAEVNRLIHPLPNLAQKQLPASHAATMLDLCSQMNTLAQEASQKGIEVIPSPQAEINTLLSLSNPT